MQGKIPPPPDNRSKEVHKVRINASRFLNKGSGRFDIDEEAFDAQIEVASVMKNKSSLPKVLIIRNYI